ncbi:MAG: hypothetical protein QF805_23425, partial [Pirellulaceae bacterium]|nr:hypothetical protein [Pirellulaceae bacterium]
TPDEAAAVFSLAQQLVSLGEQMQPLEKHYLAVIGDVDAHFHVHCLPKRVDDAKLGPFIMSPAGWRGALTVLDAPDHESFVNDLRTRFQEGGSC